MTARPRRLSALTILSLPAILAFLAVLGLSLYFVSLRDELPSLAQIENPDFVLASVAYTADGVELARYGRQNRSWVPYEGISQHVKDALIATEDRRFERHWGMDLLRTMSAVTQSVLWKIGLPFKKQGGSTITQQLARNLYNEQIGFAFTLERKLKEMMTAVELERRYTKREIVEMYLNTVPFRHNAFGIEAAARTYFQKSAADLDVLESASLVGMLKATTQFDPIKNPEQSRLRRNVVLRQMIKSDLLDEEFFETWKDSTTTTRFRSADVTVSFAPYFAEYVRNWLSTWGKDNGMDVYGKGLKVYTTLDSRLQTAAQDAVSHTMDGLQAVVNCEWSAASSPRLVFAENVPAYLEDECSGPGKSFAYYWQRHEAELTAYIMESGRFAHGSGGRETRLATLRSDKAFMDSLKTEKARLEAGLVSIDPKTGHVLAWVGGRNLADDWYDHVAIARRQPGSTFKPLVYTAAIDEGYSPSYKLRDTRFVYVDPWTGDEWSPGNFGGEFSDSMLTLREGLARSLNTITGQLIIEIKPATAVRYARRMGISSDLEAVPSLALGTSEVSLLELANAYSTLANLGIRNDPVVVTRIDDQNGNPIYEAKPAPREALSDQTSAVILDLMREVINESYGTGHRIRWQYGLTGYDFAGKTGTTQEGADGWFMLMHPELVTGAWVGFNDRRVTFRSTFWGQGGHNALFVVGDYLQRVTAQDDVALSMAERFPPPEAFGSSSMGVDDLPTHRREEW